MKTKTTLLLLAMASFLASMAPAQTVGGIKNITDNKAGISYNANARTVTNNYTVQPEDHTLLVNATTAAVTITLPAVGSQRFPFVVVKKIDSSTNTVTIDGAGSNTIDGATTVVLRNRYSSVILHADGTEWRWLNASATANGVAALTAGATVAFAPDATTTLFTLTPGEAETINGTTTNAVKGRLYTIRVLTSGTSSYVLTFSTNFKVTGTLATGTVSAKTFAIHFVFDGTNFVELSRTTAM